MQAIVRHLDAAYRGINLSGKLHDARMARAARRAAAPHPPMHTLPGVLAGAYRCGMARLDVVDGPWLLPHAVLGRGCTKADWPGGPLLTGFELTTFPWQVHGLAGTVLEGLPHGAGMLWGLAGALSGSSALTALAAANLLGAIVGRLALQPVRLAVGLVAEGSAMALSALWALAVTFAVIITGGPNPPPPPPPHSPEAVGGGGPPPPPPAWPGERLVPAPWPPAAPPRRTQLPMPGAVPLGGAAANPAAGGRPAYRHPVPLPRAPAPQYRVQDLRRAQPTAVPGPRSAGARAPLFQHRPLFPDRPFQPQQAAVQRMAAAPAMPFNPARDLDHDLPHPRLLRRFDPVPFPVLGPDDLLGQRANFHRNWQQFMPPEPERRVGAFPPIGGGWQGRPWPEAGGAPLNLGQINGWDAVAPPALFHDATLAAVRARAHQPGRGQNATPPPNLRPARVVSTNEAYNLVQERIRIFATTVHDDASAGRAADDVVLRLKNLCGDDVTGDAFRGGLRTLQDFMDVTYDDPCWRPVPDYEAQRFVDRGLGALADAARPDAAQARRLADLLAAAIRQNFANEPSDRPCQAALAHLQRHMGEAFPGLNWQSDAAGAALHQAA